MRQFAILFEERATRALEKVRVDLGPVRADAFDDAMAQALERLQALPWMGPPALIRGRWSKTDRRLIVGQTGYLLFYRVHEAAELIFIVSIRHEKQRPPKL